MSGKGRAWENPFAESVIGHLKDEEVWVTDFSGQLQYPDGFVDEDGGYIHFAFDYNRHDLIYVGAKLPE